MTTLYHYTCDHGRADIGDHGRLVPPAQLAPMSQQVKLLAWQQTLLSIIWLTDLDTPLRSALGLTSKTVACDRTVHRYRVENYSAMHYPSIRRDLPKPLRESLESADGVLPMHWWVAYTPVPVVYDPITVGAA